MNITSTLVTCVDNWLQNLYTKMYSHHTETYENTVEVHVQETSSPLTKTLVLRILINEEHKQVHIPNIFIPLNFHRQGIGFGLIKEILKVANVYRYELFIVDMTPSFYDRLLNRNAQPAGYDAVRIDTTTRL
ncbi:hypothetical protein QNH39_26410 [Neobacillus novalis]|uniref:Uncharacterized protein n=1 Tax=Neobacillus novalis TaxID=220687 RepID=A0AA95MPM6_9BACI|nr:hypothetical protein [Neobacillus novalis]WHY86064.1 hypothetical protein QNH39_26410 [Neobacillus novalis]